MPWLRCENTIRKTSVDFPIRKVLTTIGRGPGTDLVLDDPSLAPTHANIMRTGGQTTVALLGSGELYVNGRRCKTSPLAEGDKLLLGAFQLT